MTQPNTCKLVTDLEPGVIGVGLAGWGAVLVQVLFKIPALGLIKCVEQQGVLLNVRLQVQMRV